MARRREQELSPQVQLFLDSLPQSARRVLTTSGADLIEGIGLDVVRGVVRDVMLGVNIRDSTEPLTRQRIALLNAAMVSQYISIPDPDRSIDAFVAEVARAIETTRFSRSDAWMLNWALGLTDKGIQNVLRDDHLGLSGYTKRFLDALDQTAETARNDFGELVGNLRVGDREVPLNWLFVLYLATGIGCQTLTVRGSEKSTYGKLFEKLILGSVLSVLGFEFAPQGITSPTPGQFWLSTRSKRESDATLLIAPGEGVYFDIGFIGRGNSEITLDKVSRFERVAEFNKQRYGMATYIIVDRIGARSRLEALAEAIDGTVVQMSMSYWPQTLARHLQNRFGYSDEIIDAEPQRAHDIIQQRLTSAPIENLLQRVASVLEAEADIREAV